MKKEKKRPMDISNGTRMLYITYRCYIKYESNSLKGKLHCKYNYNFY